MTGPIQPPSAATAPLHPDITLAQRLPRPVGYVLGGGGSWGAVQLGILEALAHTDLVADLVVGTSVGSLNGAVLAADPAGAVARLGALWPRVTKAQVFPGGWLRGLRTLSDSKAWVYDNALLTDLLTQELPVADIESLALPFVAVATDFATGALAELDSGDLRSALLASSAIPGIYPWVEREGRRLVDGMLVANVPITVAVRRGARSLVVLDCGLAGVEAGNATTFVEVLAQSAAIYARRQIEADVRSCGHVPIVWLSRGVLNATSQLDFSATATLAEEARLHSLRVLHGLRGAGALAPGLYGATPEMRASATLRDLVR